MPEFVKPAEARTVMLELVVVPAPGNEDNPFWEPSDLLVSWGVAKVLFDHGVIDGWKVESVREVER